MTSEVVLMNRSAVALAADSAVTVTDWARGRPEHRFFKGANKIFNLSERHPVGMMVHSSATIQGVPIEVIAKAYRKKLGANSFSHLADYANEFFRYLADEPRMFPVEKQIDQFKTHVSNRAFLYVYEMGQQDSVKGATNPEERAEAISQAWAAIKKNVQEASYLGSSDEPFVAEATARYRGELIDALQKDKVFDGVVVPIDELVEVSIAAIFKKDLSLLSETGIVIAGYGEDEYFPSCIEYRCFGLVLGKCLYAEHQRKCVDHDNTSHVVPLAQSDMVQTFINGVGPNAMKDVAMAFMKVLEEFEKLACEDGDRESLKAEMLDKFYDETLERLFETHTSSLRRVIGSFSIDELAQLAETLISIESLKERVTRPTESVSGPVDVAVISKGDGFIWIRRKHYFDAKLNHRYFDNRPK